MDAEARQKQPIESASWIRWAHEIRRVEFERLIEQVPLGRDSAVLELGSGDGFQLGLLRQRFQSVFAIDPEFRPASTAGFCFAKAESLPFPDRAFDLVVSCCVLEHLDDRPRGLEEAVRVLKPGGFMAHVVPAPWWKAASILLNPVGYPWRVAEKWLEFRRIRRLETESASAAAPEADRPGLADVLGRWVYPPIHGTYPSHWAEYRAYAPQSWRRFFAHPQLEPVAELPLPAYTQFGFLRFRLPALRARLAPHGFAGSRGFILRKLA